MENEASSEKGEKWLKNYLKERISEGPWSAEPDRQEWKYKGFPCLIVRNHMGVLCGYVGVPSNHPYYQMNYEEIPLEVHGGLTYSQHCRENICHKPAEGEPDDVWWLGFDCGHYGDLIPCYKDLNPDFEYRDMNYVKAEVEGLADQLHEAMNPSESQEEAVDCSTSQSTSNDSIIRKRMETAISLHNVLSERGVLVSRMDIDTLLDLAIKNKLHIILHKREDLRSTIDYVDSTGHLCHFVNEPGWVHIPKDAKEHS